MEVPNEVLAAVGGAVAAGFAALWLQVRAQIDSLKRALKEAQGEIRTLRDHFEAEHLELLIQAHDREKRLASIVARFGEPKPTDQTKAGTEPITRRHEHG